MLLYLSMPSNTLCIMLYAICSFNKGIEVKKSAKSTILRYLYFISKINAAFMLFFVLMLLLLLFFFRNKAKGSKN